MGPVVRSRAERRKLTAQSKLFKLAYGYRIVNVENERTRSKTLQGVKNEIIALLALWELLDVYVEKYRAHLLHYRWLVHWAEGEYNGDDSAFLDPFQSLLQTIRDWFDPGGREFEHLRNSDNDWLELFNTSSLKDNTAKTASIADSLTQNYGGDAERNTESAETRSQSLVNTVLSDP